MDALVIGGGVVGVCSAYYLLQEGLSVTIVDQGEIGAGCSYGNAGLIVPSHVAPLARPGMISQGLRWLLDRRSPFYIRPRLSGALLLWLWRFRQASRPAHSLQAAGVLRDLARLGRDFTADLISAENIDCSFLEAGLLQVFRTEKALQETVKQEAQYGGLGQVLDGNQVRDIEPAIRSEVAGALFHQHDNSLDPAAFVRGLAGAFRDQGGTIRASTGVRDFEVSAGRVTRVRTESGWLTPGLVVLAAGAWTPALARGLGLQIPIQPGKGYSLTYQKPARGPSLPLLLGEDWVAVTPMGAQLRYAGTLELGGLDLDIDRLRIAAVAAAPARYLDIQGELRLLETWSGLRPVTPDGLPIIGRPEGFPNVIVAAGHAMLGMTLGPVTGRLVADLACEREPAFNIQPLRVERF